MRKAVIFDQFSRCCPYFNSDTDANNGYGCDHPNQEETEIINDKEQGLCFCFCCPLGIEAEQCDLTDRNNSDAVHDEIDWDGLCSDGIVYEGEYLLINADNNASDDEKNALHEYDLYLNRYTVQ